MRREKLGFILLFIMMAAVYYDVYLIGKWIIEVF